jgi:branched-chain amino acid transport system substrate-binding protein
MKIGKSVLSLALPLIASTASFAAEPVTIGLVMPMSGPFADCGKKIERGMRLYLAANGDTVAGRKVKLIIKDDNPGSSGDVSKRLAQELVVKENVDLLAGFCMAPAAMAVAPLATEAKKAMIVLNAAASAVTTRSPYIVRVSFTLPQNSAPMATWASKNNIKKVYTLVTDYGPGYDAEAQFKKTFAAAGGQIVGELRVPLKNPDFSPYLQRIKDAKPDAVFVFMPSSAETIAFVKSFSERGLAQAGIRLIATGDLTEETVLDAMGDTALGTITSYHYSQAHKSPENDAFNALYSDTFPQDRPNLYSVAGYDGMRLIAEVLKKTAGDTEGGKFIEAAKGMSWNSPRGKISIDPATRDIVQTVYIRRVEKVGNVLQNVEFDSVANLADPGKQP